MALALHGRPSISLFQSMALNPVFLPSLRQRILPLLPRIPSLQPDSEAFRPRMPTVQSDPSYRPINPSLQLLPQSSSTSTTALPLPHLPSLLPTLPSLTQLLNGLIPQLLPQKLLDALSGLVFAVPKKKTSHRKKRQRQLAGKALKDVISLNRCPGCGRVKRANRICETCLNKIWNQYNVASRQPEAIEKAVKEEEYGNSVFKRIEKLRIGRGKDRKQRERRQKLWQRKMAPKWEEERKYREANKEFLREKHTRMRRWRQEGAKEVDRAIVHRLKHENRMKELKKQSVEAKMEEKRLKKEIREEKQAKRSTSNKNKPKKPHWKDIKAEKERLSLEKTRKALLAGEAPPTGKSKA